MITLPERAINSTLLNYAVDYEREKFTGSLTLVATVESFEWLRSQTAHYLSLQEHALIKRMVSVRRQESFLRGRWAAKTGLLAFFGGEPTAWDITPGVFGQPIVRYLGQDRPPVTLSISHSDSGALALIAPAAWPAAVDCELISSKNLQAIVGQMTKSEIEFSSVQTQVAYVTALTMMWSLKEAASKILGGGLAIDFTMLELSDLKFSAQGNMLALFTYFGHLQGIACAKQSCVTALVFPESSKIHSGVAPLMHREIDVLAMGAPQIF